MDSDIEGERSEGERVEKEVEKNDTEEEEGEKKEESEERERSPLRRRKSTPLSLPLLFTLTWMLKPPKFLTEIPLLFLKELHRLFLKELPLLLLREHHHQHPHRSFPGPSEFQRFQNEIRAMTSAVMDSLELLTTKVAGLHDRVVALEDRLTAHMDSTAQKFKTEVQHSHQTILDTIKEVAFEEVQEEETGETPSQA